MSFSKSTRFASPRTVDLENRSSALNVNASGTTGKTPVKKVLHQNIAPVNSLRRETYDGRPSFMQATTASENRKNRPPVLVGRLKFQLGEGGNTYAPIPDFGSEARGSTPMKKGRHGRFSILDSYFIQTKGAGADSPGLGHEEDKAIRKKTDFAVKIEPNNERFGKGSYLEEALHEGPKIEFTRFHKDFLEEVDEFNCGTSSFKSRTILDRAEWVKLDTCLEDKELADCDGRHRLIDARSEDFDMEKLWESGLSSNFKDATIRFKEPKPIDPGSSSLGPETEVEVTPETTKCGVIYKRDTKHGRFSEFGGLWHIAN